MAKRIILFVLVVLVAVVVGSYLYTRYRTDRRLNAGEVLSDDNGKVSTTDGTAPVMAPTRSETAESLDNHAAKATVAQTSTASNSTAASPFGNGYGGASAAPATDTLAPNAPNRAAFAGTGRFQVYRQGDLTWRINTDNGNTCVLFATMDQWRKPLVYRSACPNG